MTLGTGYNLSFPTPDSLPEETVCRNFILPADVLFLGAFMGALDYLTDPAHWQQVGSVTPDEAAEAMFNAIDAAYALAEAGECGTNVPAPYWDDESADDADDTAPVDDQPWYGEIIEGGEGLEWRERVGIWAITAFVAIAATPAAAIAFLPIANRFALAFKQHNLGGIVRVLIDAVEVATVDTYAASDGVISTSVIIPASMGFRLESEDPPVLWVVMSDEVNPAVDGEASIQVLRQRLSEEQVSPPPNVRYNPECDCIETSPDDGATWTETPDADPRHSDVFRRPPISTSDPRCDAAHRNRLAVESWISDSIHGATTVANATAGFAAATAVFAFLTGGATLLIDVIVGVVDALFAIGIEVVDDAMTDEVYDTFECILYCHIGDDGQMSIAQKVAIADQVNSDIGGIAATVLDLVLDLFGEVGMSNTGNYTDETGDCSECACEWCKVWTDFADWDAVLGTQGTQYIYMGFTLPEVQAVTSVQAEWSWNLLGGASTSGLGFYNSYTLTGPHLFRSVSPFPTPVGTTLGMESTDDQTTNQIVVGIVGSDGTAVCTLTKVIMTGLGIPPDSGDDWP